MKRIVSALLIISISFLSSGCSAFVSGTQRLRVTASEPDAKIYVNGAYVGEGTVTTRVPRNENVAVMAKKEGYLPASQEIGNKMSQTGILDIVAGCMILIPLIGLAFPGSHTIDSNNINIMMEKEKK